ncbi:hypothetical protein [Glycomyces harbinensis]|uniref:Uncharacterized protein n=1 Tax=Glycomyces harbinensis TaxID=58114 RepID=A0A1G6RMU5_9ACTN|nr:hypothetical protein [Glycomyces harbinensis]SDD05868.1 hypothetical protein SAMN05216270_101567 [Glycomyces harbinensis]
MSSKTLYRMAVAVGAVGAALIVGAAPVQAHSEPGAGHSASQSALSTFTGTVVATGNGCLELRTADRAYPLFGAAAFGFVGQRVIVEGTLRPVIGVIPCARGMVLLAEDVRPA